MSNAPTLASRTLNIPAFRFEQLTAALAKLGKKAVKLGCKAPVASILRSYTVDVSEDKKFPELVEWNEVKIDYEVIRKAGDYVFIAKVEHADEVNGVPRNKVSGINLSNEHAARFVTSPIVCSHCGINRKRNAGYVVQSCNDETVMVGSTCLEVFLGVDPAAAVAGMEFDAAISEIGNDGERWGYGSAAPRVVPLDEFAAATISLVSKNGFVNAAAAEFGKVKTGDDVLLLTLGKEPRLADWRKEMTPTDEHKAMAASVVKRLSDRILPSYINNPTALDAFAFKFGILLNKGYVGVKDAQLAAAAIYYEIGKIAKESVKSTVKNEFYPCKEGDKVAVEVSINMVKEVFSSFGTSLLIKMVSTDGYTFSSFYSGAKESFTPGSTVKVSGKVKKLDDNARFGKSVMLSHLKVVG